MPGVKIKKALYLGSSIADLNKIRSEEIKDATPERTHRIASQLIEKANEADSDGDEEKAYILYLRLASLISDFKKNSNNNGKVKPSIAKDINRYFERAITNAERLKKSLVERYEAVNKQKEEELAKKAEVSNIVKNSEAEALPTTETPSLDSKMPTHVTCKQLYDLLNESSLTTLIIDTRSQKDFFDSQMKFPRVINIPENLLTPGVTPNLLGKKISSEFKDLWQQRNEVDHIIMIDWNSDGKNVPIGSPLYCLNEAMNKLEGATFLKTNPLVLEGGYKEWVLYYPMFTTNANVIEPSNVANYSANNGSLSNQDKVEVFYPSLDEETISGPPREFKSAQPIAALRKSKPGVTPPTINRALKPPEYNGNNMLEMLPYIHDNVIDNLEMVREELAREKEFENFRLKKEKEAEEGMRVELQKQEDVLRNKYIELEKKSEAKSEEYDKTLELMERMKLDLQTKAERIKELEELQRLQGLGGETNRLRQQVIVLREERKKRENANKIKPQEIPQKPKEMNHSPSKGQTGLPKSKLNRSYSSPNIAQMLAEEDNKDIVKPIPHFDRGQKPNPQFRTFEPEEGASFSERLRNLNPIYSSGARALTGLKNLGNTCYMNAVIQCLSATTPLAAYFMNDNYKNDINKTNKMGTGGQLLDQFAHLIKILWNGRFKSVVPKDFKAIAGQYIDICSGNEQQDSHEFLIIIIDKLHCDLNKGYSSNPPKTPNWDSYPTDTAPQHFWNYHTDLNKSIFVNLFDGVIQSKMTCLVCNKVSNSYETFHCLSIPIPKNGRSSLRDCINNFVKPEKMPKEQGWKCPSCDRLVEAMKEMIIRRLPPILMFHLKRFSYQGVWREKLQTPIDFPIVNLDMTPFVTTKEPPVPYNLYGIVNHYGRLDGGHYIAKCRRNLSENWFKFDDQEVMRITSDEVVNSAEGYLLFYSRFPLSPN